MRRGTRRLLVPLAMASLTMFAIPLWTVPAAAASPPQYRVVSLGNLGPGTGAATAINDHGEVVGYSSTGPAMHPFRWRDGVMTDLGALEQTGHEYAIASGINDRGDIVGSGTVAGGTAMHGFVLRNGRMTDLGTLGGTYSAALAINDRGQIVGQSSRADGTWHGFLWQNGRMTDLGTDIAVGIDNGGTVVGSTSFPSGYHAYRWQHGTVTDLGTLGSSYSEARDINESGWIVGDSGLSNDNAQSRTPFLYRHGTMTALPGLGAGYESATALNDRGQIIGLSQDPATMLLRSVMWQNGRLIDLTNRGIPSGEMGSGAGGIAAINNHGQIVGSYYFAYGQPGPALFQPC